MSGSKTNIWVGGSFLQDVNRILILGESDYGNLENLKEYIPCWIRWEKRDHTFSRLFSACTCDRAASVDEDERWLFWNRVAFYNLVDRVLLSRKNRPTKEDYEKGCKALPNVLKSIRPLGVWILGKGQATYSTGVVQECKYICEAAPHPAAWGIKNKDIKKSWDKLLRKIRKNKNS